MSNEATNNGKPKVAFFDFACCEGCQLTVIDALQTHLDLLDAVEIVQFREAMTEKGEDYQIAFIEGSCTRASDEARLKRIREQADIVVALGACAHLGGINALKNPPLGLWGQGELVRDLRGSAYQCRDRCGRCHTRLPH